MSPKKPKQIIILGKKIKIVYKSLTPLMGEYDGDNGIIYIDEELKGEEFQSTLLHEILHTILHLTGMVHAIFHNQEQPEEGIVYALENGLSSLVKLNCLTTKK